MELLAFMLAAAAMGMAGSSMTTNQQLKQELENVKKQLQDLLDRIPE